MISLRTTNAIHEYLACLLQRVKKFPCKLSGFEGKAQKFLKVFLKMQKKTLSQKKLTIYFNEG
jgi:hypothetical protein